MLHSARLLIIMRKNCVVVDIWCLIIIISSITSAEDVMFLPLLVCLLICLSVNNFTRKLLIGSSWNFFYHRCIVRQGHLHQIPEVTRIQIRIWIMEFWRNFHHSKTSADNSRRCRQILMKFFWWVRRQQKIIILFHCWSVDHDADPWIFNEILIRDRDNCKLFASNSII